MYNCFYGHYGEASEAACHIHLHRHYSSWTEDFFPNLFKWFLGVFQYGVQKESSTSAAESCQCQKVFLTASTLSCAAGSLENTIQKQETQALTSQDLFFHFKNDGKFYSKCFFQLVL